MKDSSFDIRISKFISSAPVYGILIVLALYIWAASLYPGGSVRHPEKQGFDWVHNFWCDLLTTTALNGELNSGRPYGIASMVLLCGVVAILFVLFADAYTISKRWKVIIKVCGVSSMICGALIFTSLHNIMIGISSLFALLPILGIFKGLIQSRSLLHLSLGFLVLVLLGLCNIIYYFRFLIEWLPLIQKVALGATLFWLVMMSIAMMKRPDSLSS